MLKPSALSRNYQYIILGVSVLLIIVGGSLFYYQQTKEVHIPVDWADAQNNVRPQLVREGQESEKVFSVEFVPGIHVAYALTSNGKYAFIGKAELEKWHLDVETLHKQAMINLEKYAKEVKIDQPADRTDLASRYAIVEAGDGFSAAYILSSGLRKRVEATLGTPLIAAIPTRDFLVFWAMDFSIHDSFRSQVTTEFMKDTKYGLTSSLFRIQEDGTMEVESGQKEPNQL